jgi:hypothetical protein
MRTKRAFSCANFSFHFHAMRWRSLTHLSTITRASESQPPKSISPPPSGRRTALCSARIQSSHPCVRCPSPSTLPPSTQAHVKNADWQFGITPSTITGLTHSFLALQCSPPGINPSFLSHTLPSIRFMQCINSMSIQFYGNKPGERSHPISHTHTQRRR